MKKIISLILSVGIMLLIPGMGVFAKADNSSIPAEVLAYAQGAGMASMKSFMKDPNKGYIGNGVSSAEEIDALALGQCYALSYFDLNDYSSLSACAKPAGEWLFSLDNKDGELCYFTVIAEEEGGFSTYGAVDAKNLSAVLGVIRRLSESEGVAFAPVIHQTMSGFVVAQSFGGGDKVITVPGGAFSLDGSYLEVTSSEELPTFEEYTSAVLSSLIPYIDPETGEPIDLASLPIGSGEIELLPHPAAAAAAANNSSIPEDVLAYAQGAGMASMKSFMKDPNKGYIGKVVSSAEEIEALALGQGYALSYFDLNDYSSLSACAKPAGEWLFSLDNENGAVVYFGVAREEEGGLSHFGAIDAKNLSSALGVIRRLSESEGVAFAPVINQTTTGFVVAQSFGGGDKVITVPGSAFSLDGSYLEVTSSEELPTFEEYTDALRAKFKPLNTDEFGKITFDVKYGDDPIELLPHPAAAAAPVAAEPGSKAAGKTWLVPVIACSAAALIVAAAVFFGVRTKKARENR